MTHEELNLLEKKAEHAKLTAHWIAPSPDLILELIAAARQNVGLKDLLERCRDRLDGHDDSDDLWIEVNKALLAKVDGVK